MRLVLLSFFFLLTACSSPQNRLAQLEKDLLDLLGPAADLKVTVENTPFQLPLPPPPEVQTAQKSRARQLLLDAEKIDTTALLPAQCRQLRQYRLVLTDLSGHAPGWPLDPSDYTLREPLERCLAEPGGEGLALLLEKMPDYYAEVERRWGHSRLRNLAPAVAQCLANLDRLDQVENTLNKYPEPAKTRLQAALPPARAALKNYLGQCRSGVLE